MRFDGVPASSAMVRWNAAPACDSVLVVSQAPARLWLSCTVNGPHEEHRVAYAHTRKVTWTDDDPRASRRSELGDEPS